MDWTPTVVEDPAGSGEYRILLTAADVRLQDLLA